MYHQAFKIYLLNDASLTSKMIPLRMYFDSMPIFRSSKLNLSNFSGVSLLSILLEKETET